MPKGPKGEKRPADVIGAAIKVAKIATGEIEETTDDDGKDKAAQDLAKISTSHVERHNLTMRMSMRRFTRLTNAFSKKIENHCHALALYFVWYNFCRQHGAHKLSPAMAAGITDTLRDMEWIVSLIEARALKPGPRGTYKKGSAN